MAVARASVSREGTASLVSNDLQQPAFTSHSPNQALPLHQEQESSYSSHFQQYSSPYDQAFLHLESNFHSCSVSQPSSSHQSAWQSASFYYNATSPHYENVFTVQAKDEPVCATASPSSEPPHKMASSSGITMGEQETSPRPSISGNSIPQLPPLSPSPNAYQWDLKKYGADINQLQCNQKGHRKSRSEIPFGISGGKECSFSRTLCFGQGDESLDDVPILKLNSSNSGSIKELSRAPDRIAMEVVDEREEGMDDLFSIYMNVDKVENCQSSSAEVDSQTDNTKPLKKRGISVAWLAAEQDKALLTSLQRTKSLRECLDSDKEESDKEEEHLVGDSHETMVDDSDQKAELGKGESHGGHQRSASMDSLTNSIVQGDGAQHSSDPYHRRQVRHQHSLSIDGSMSTKLSFLNGEIYELEMKKIMADDKLAEIALIDPKRAKRILANRQSAARSKERKVHYISELERKVQTLQTEATTLSAQLTLMQRDSTGLANENNELKLRLQSLEQQAQLREALQEALRDEVQRLKIATGQIQDQALNHQFFEIGHQNSQLVSQQASQQHSQAHVQQ